MTFESSCTIFHGHPLLLYVLVGGQSKFCSVVYLYQVEDRKLLPDRKLKCVRTYCLYYTDSFIALMLVCFIFQVATLILLVTSIFGHEIWSFTLPGGISAGHMFELTFYICAILSNLPMCLWNVYK